MIGRQRSGVSWRAIAVSAVVVAFAGIAAWSSDLYVGGGGTPDYPTIQAAIIAAASGDTIHVAAGTYTEVGQIVISKNLTIVGADRATTIIKPSANTGNSGDGKAWWLVNPCFVFNLSGVTLDGTGKMIFQGIRHKGTGTIQSVRFTGITYNASGPDYAGFAIYAFGQCGAVNVSDCVFDNIGREGIAYWGAGTTGTYADNTYTGNGLGNHMDYGVEVTTGAVVTITGSTITNCRGEVGGDPTSWTSAGIMVLGNGSKASITGNTITGNYWGIAVGIATGTETPEGHARDNNITGNYNLGARHGSAYGVFDAAHNWWGNASGPTHAGNPGGTGDAVGDNVVYNPWVQSAIGETVTENLGNGETLTGETTVGADVTVTGGTGVDVTVARYDGNPTGSGLGTIEVGYIDVYVPDTSGVTQIEVRLYYAAGTDTSTLRLHWWNGTAWVECSNQGINIAGGYLWAIITASTVPSLTDLHGTIFGGGSASIWYEDFEYTGQAAMVTAGWVFGTNGENLWHHASQASVPAIAYSGLTPFPSIDHAVWFAHPSTAQYRSGSTNGASVSPQVREAQALVQPKGAGEGYPYGELTSPSINVSGFAGLTVSVSFHYFREVECYSLGSYDRTYAQARFGGGPWQTIWTRDSKDCTAMESWRKVDPILQVPVPAGTTTMQIRFVFDAVDNVGNGYLGWLIDDVEILQPGPVPPPTLAIATSCPLPGGTVGQSYGPVQLQASGGTGPYTWTATVLPSGLDCTTAGVVSGTPDTAGTYPSVVLTVTDSATQTASKTCSLTIAPVSQDCPWCDLALLNFENALTDQKLAPSWTVSGLWHVATNGCANCGTPGSNHYGYFGKDASCSYDNAGVAVTGYLTSPEVPLASCIQSLAIGFKHYREVEAFPGPGSYDRTSVQVRWLNAGGWGAWQTIWLKDSTNPSPDYCLDVVIGPVAVPTGATKAQVRFGFESVDGVFNNFMGWAVDEIWVKNSTCVSGPATAPLSLSGLQVKDVSRAGITVLNVPNPVRDVHTTTFSVRGVGIEAVRIQIFDINQNLVFEEEVAGTELVWHTVDAYGEYLANGVYFYRALVLASGQWMATGFEKLVILR